MTEEALENLSEEVIETAEVIETETVKDEIKEADWTNIGKPDDTVENPIDTNKPSKDDEGGFTLFGKEEEESEDVSKDGTDSPKSKTRDYSKFKEVLGEEDDINDDDALLEKIKGLKSKEKAQVIINTANERFEKDEQVQNWISWLQADEDELLEQTLILEKGYSQEDAKDKVLEMKDTDPREYRALLNKTKGTLNSLLNQKADAIKVEVEEAAKLLKNINPGEIDTKILKSASEQASKIEEFAGLKLGINEKNREEFLKPVRQLIESGAIIKDLKSKPDLLAKVAYFIQYEKQITSAIQSRFYPKKKFIEGLEKAPHSSGMAKPSARKSVINTGDFNPEGW